MNKEKETVISDICPFYKEYGSCDRCNSAVDIDDPPCYFECMANAIIDNNYHKLTDKLKLHLRSLLLEDLFIKQYMYDKAFDTYIEYAQSHICDSTSEDLRQDMVRTRDLWRKAKEMLKSFDTIYG